MTNEAEERALVERIRIPCISVDEALTYLRSWKAARAASPVADNKTNKIKTIRGAVARGWCYTENSHKVMDTDLAEAISQEIYKLIYNEDFNKVSPKQG